MTSDKNELKALLAHKVLEPTAFQVLERFSTNEQHIILILSGLLRVAVLKLILTKRWRINYGVDVNDRRKMAISFRTKDVAAELAEFGHPDVDVCFTFWSYYYSGEFAFVTNLFSVSTQ